MPIVSLVCLHTEFFMVLHFLRNFDFLWLGRSLMQSRLILLFLELVEFKSLLVCIFLYILDHELEMSDIALHFIDLELLLFIDFW